MNQLPDSLSGMVSSISNLILGQGGGGRAGSGEQESRECVLVDGDNRSRCPGMANVKGH